MAPPSAEPPVKKARFGGAAESDGTPASEAVRFHLIEARAQPALGQEIDAGGREFACEYYNQVC